MFLPRGGPPLWKVLGFWLLLLILGFTGCASEPDTLGDLDEPLTEDDGSYNENEAAFSNIEEGENNLEVSNPSQPDNVDLLGDGADENYNNNGYYNEENMGEDNSAYGYNENLEEDNPYANSSYDNEESNENSEAEEGLASEGGYNYNNLTGESYNDVLNAEVNPLAAEQGVDLLASNDALGENPYAAEGGGEELYGNNYSGDSTGESMEDTYTTDAAGMEDLSGTDLSGTMASVPTMGGLPEMGSKMHYIVQKGDTLGVIAEKIYGDKEQWREILQLTGMENPDLIYPGEVVYYRLTESSQAFAAAYENTPKGEMTVEVGDSLASLAQRIYGDPGQWQTLWRANDTINNPDRLEVGQIVYFINNAAVMAQVDLWKQHFQQTSSWAYLDHSEKKSELSKVEAQSNLQPFYVMSAENFTLKPWI